MNILLLGAGGREHALAWKLRQSPAVARLAALPGSDGIASCAERIAGDPSAPAAVVAAAAAMAADLVVIGPEAPLAAGVSDALRAAGRRVLGPSRAAARLETSKIFAKEFMARHGIPTAPFDAVDAMPAARRALARLGYPVALKADGLAAGKGVVIAHEEREALAALEAMLSGALVGDAGRRVVIEAGLAGPELSLLALTDGARALPLPPARDHKRLCDGDQGPNTGGMGAVSTDALLPPWLEAQLRHSVIEPTLAGMAAESAPFQGLLYCGLMLTASGPQVLEFNARFGDPEAQAILPRCGGDWAELLLAAAAGTLPEAMPPPLAAASACVVAAAEGYPEAPRRGDPITGLDTLAPPALLFHAGTRLAPDGWVTAGGRVLSVSACAGTLAAARAHCYHAMERIRFRGMQVRRDIGANAAI
jgi:phosphoribosylamine--glycine ligase